MLDSHQARELDAYSWRTDPRRIGFPESYRRPESEPTDLGRFQRTIHRDDDDDDGRRRVTSQRRRSQSYPRPRTGRISLDHPTASPAVSNHTAKASADEAILDPLDPANTGFEPRVLQRVVPPSSSELNLRDSPAKDHELHAARATPSSQSYHIDSPSVALEPSSGNARQRSEPGSPSEAKLLPFSGVVAGSITPQQGTQMPSHEDWQKIRKLRIGTWSLRSRIQEIRRDLRIKQYAKSVAEDRLLQFLKARVGGGKSATKDEADKQKSISALLKDYQRAREEYGPMEDDCNLLEDHLNRDEYELTKLEEQFYSQQTDPQDLPDVDYGIDSNFLVASEDSDEGADGDCHPLVAKFLSRMGDLDILQERHAEREEERDYLESEKETRQRVGLDLAADDQEWLDNYHLAASELLGEIRHVEEEAEILREECFDAGLVDEDGNPTSLDTQERRSFIHETDIDAGSETSEFVKFPALLPRPSTKGAQHESATSEPNTMLDSTDDRINQWLLSHLRSSPLDVDLLARIYEYEFGPIESIDDWQERVLTLWYKDGTRKGPHGYRIYSSGIGSQAPHEHQFLQRPLSDGSEDSMPQSVDGKDSLGSSGTSKTPPTRRSTEGFR